MSPQQRRAALDWGRAGRLIADRMAEKGLDQIGLARRAEVSDATIRTLTRGVQKAYRHTQLGRIAQALDWPPHTIERLAQGEEPPRTIDYINRGELLRKLRVVRQALDDVEDDLRRSG